MKNQASFRVVVAGVLLMMGSAACNKAQPGADPVKQTEPVPAPSLANVDVATNQSPADRWVSQVRVAFGDQLCKPDGYFQACFTVTNDECRALVLKHFTPCLSQPGAIPTEVNAESGRRAGTILGSCIGTAYEMELIKAGKALKNARCADPRNWVP